MNCTICGEKSNKTYDNINLCELCYQTNIEHLNSFNANLEYESPDHIIDNIYLGSQKCGVDVNKLFELNIKYVLILGKGMTRNFNDVIYKVIEIDDSLEQDLSNYIKEALKFISESQQNNSNILVHCVSGISRSASIVIAYIMDKHKMNYDQAFSYVKTKRVTIRPNSNFIAQLNNLQF
jgi:dual specificity MAP kinase phosphatase